MSLAFPRRKTNRYEQYSFSFYALFYFFALVLTNYFLFAIGFVAETSTFIIECGEDDNDMVVKESFKLKDAVESVAGKIDGL